MLKVFSNFLDRGGPFLSAPRFSLLDAGCGVGVLGICAAGALLGLAAAGSVCVRAQDRDDLARAFTGYNARRNGLSEANLTAHAEPLLAGPGPWNCILTNIPAKAGQPVLEDFVSRSAGMLAKDGLVFLVAVNTLAAFFRSRIGASLLREEAGKEHTVFVYGGVPEQEPSPVIFDERFPQAYPFYIRNRDRYEMEGIPYRLDTVHGAPEFDRPGGAAQAAAKLAVKLGLDARLRGKEGALLVSDAGQGHFALWLSRCLDGGSFRWLLSGRNVVALASAQSALNAALPDTPENRPRLLPRLLPPLPSADLSLDYTRIEAAGPFDLIAFFPERLAAWEGPLHLAAPGGIILAGMGSAEAERFDRKKPAAVQRLGDLKRNGFRALMYQKR